ncbi:MAG TPA: tetratricopeptide repeat protein [Polyangiaceae bacterium]
MPKARTAPADPRAVDLLEKATLARTSGLRAKYATRGLQETGADTTTQAMLLRQLYLAHMEARRFAEALSVAERMIETGVMPDVAEQDASRACLGLGDATKALEHLRIASRVGPASRRAFHLWTLGSTLYLMGRAAEAASILSRASRWGTTARPLYAAQLALARRAAGEGREEGSLNLEELRDRLEEAPCGQGYGQFVLGELSFHLGDQATAKRYLEGFLRRTTEGRVALAVALSAEIQLAKRLLKTIGRGK